MIDLRKEKAIVEIVNGSTMVDAAKVAGISRTTLYTWLDDPEFKAELEAKQKMVADEVQSFISNNTLKYVQALHNLAMNTADKRTALTALTTLLDRSLGKVASKNEIVVDQNDVTIDLIDEALKGR